jgi:hypothetical protein
MHLEFAWMGDGKAFVYCLMEYYVYDLGSLELALLVDEHGEG